MKPTILTQGYNPLGALQLLCIFPFCADVTSNALIQAINWQLAPDGRPYLRVDGDTATYWVMSAATTYSGARELCQKYGGKLATIYDRKEFWAMRAGSDNFGLNIGEKRSIDQYISGWLGYEQASASAKWKTVDGKMGNRRRLKKLRTGMPMQSIHAALL